MPEDKTVTVDKTETVVQATDKGRKKPDWVCTNHVLVTEDQELKYMARVGCLTICDEKEKPECEIFSVGYFKEGNDEKGQRPLTFAFNGGPGASSIWVNLGALGPRRIDFGDGIKQPAPFRQLTDNEYSWLAFTDLVIVDALGTGYSRALGEKDPKDYWGVDGDAKVMSEFVHRYCSQHGLWNAPKFLMGESYGGLRAPAMCKVLQRDMGIELAGLVLVSPVVDYATTYFAPGNHVAFAVALPTMTATAHYHGKLDDTLSESIDEAVKEANTFAVEEYLPAMALGGALRGERRKTITKTLSRLTGLSAEYIEQCRLAVSPQRFCKELLRDKGKTIGRFDTRLEGDDADHAGDKPEYDPADALTTGSFVSVFNDILSRELSYNRDRPYVFQSPEPFKHWKWDCEHKGKQGFVNLVPSLRHDLCENEYLAVHFACGLYDIATPFFGAEYTVNAMDLPEQARKRVSISYYPGGHMMYTDKSNHKKLFEDIRSFYKSSPLVGQ